VSKSSRFLIMDRTRW